MREVTMPGARVQGPTKFFAAYNLGKSGPCVPTKFLLTATSNRITPKNIKANFASLYDKSMFFFICSYIMVQNTILRPLDSLLLHKALHWLVGLWVGC